MKSHEKPFVHLTFCLSVCLSGRFFRNCTKKLSDFVHNVTVSSNLKTDIVEFLKKEKKNLALNFTGQKETPNEVSKFCGKSCSGIFCFFAWSYMSLNRKITSFLKFEFYIKKLIEIKLVVFKAISQIYFVFFLAASLPESSRFTEDWIVLLIDVIFDKLFKLCSIKTLFSLF